MCYFRLPRLIEQLCIPYGAGSYPRLMDQLAKTDLLILGDWTIQKITAVNPPLEARLPHPCGKRPQVEHHETLSARCKPVK
ncbi:hypothetical protein [Nitrococcus mobilis]|uniref:Uncharacterized protein n=1 Tax=Nitrococcus mobilis Nb-231 TaxID=314278 RepID=A4BP26_9GAMM|nr:hypothetical protein [Nitrococcus mobilis]EAR22327.1 hypothetical protein NB231_11344 [Nitrococcus mobilis Nb-231]